MTGFRRVAFVCIAAAACGGSPLGVNCPDGAFPSITVIPRDSVTGEYLGHNTTMVQTATAFADSMTLSLPPAFPWEIALWVESAAERTGTYQVTVRRPGYATWQRTNVRVRRPDGCNVRTVELEPLLQPLS